MVVMLTTHAWPPVLLGCIPVITFDAVEGAPPPLHMRQHTVRHLAHALALGSYACGHWNSFGCLPGWHAQDMPCVMTGVYEWIDRLRSRGRNQKAVGRRVCGHA
jgi:hypothetical protein